MTKSKHRLTMELPADLVRRADKIVERRNADGGPRWSRTTLVSVAVQAYLDKAEAEVESAA